MTEAQVCVECGNDYACEGYRYCLECLEAGASELDDLTTD